MIEMGTSTLGKKDDVKEWQTQHEGFAPGLGKKLAPGDSLDKRYELLDVLGIGGMGRVFKARHLILDSSVALKVLHYRGTNDSVAKERFLTEVQSAHHLAHENIVGILDAGISIEGFYYLVMPLLEGESFKEWIYRTPLEEKDTDYISQAILFILDACRGVIAAHERRILHHDLKPSNIVLAVDEDGEIVPRILDFGLAKLVEAKSVNYGIVTGTQGYIAPERNAGIDSDARSDIYSLGVILFEALTGQLPSFDDSDPTFERSKDSKYTVKQPSKINPFVSPQLDRVCLLALERDADNRYQTTEQFADALRTAWEIQDDVLGEEERPRRIEHKRIGKTLASVLICFLCVGMGVIIGRIDNPKPPETTVSRTEIEKESGLVAATKRIDAVSENAVPQRQAKEAESVSAQSPPGAVDEPMAAPEKKTPRDGVKRQSLQSDVGGTPNKADTISETNEIDELVARGYAELKSRNLIDAERMFDRAAKLDPRSPDAWYGLGRVAYEKREYTIAASRISVALGYADKPQWRIVLGEVYELAGQRDNAIEQWKRVIEQFPDSKNTAALAKTHLGRVGAPLE